MRWLLLWLLWSAPLLAEPEPRPVEAELARARQAVEQLRLRSRTLDAAISYLKEQETNKAVRHGDIPAALQQALTEADKAYADTLINAEQPGPLAAIAPLQQAGAAATVPQVDALWQGLLQRLRAQGQVSRFPAQVIEADGRQQQLEVTRIGPFIAVQGGRYLEYVPELERFRVLSRQPDGRYSEAARNLSQAAGPGPWAAPIDPSRGALVAMQEQMPGFMERLHQGGLVGYLILALALLGVVLALQRIWVLGRIAARVRRQKQRPLEPSADNPLGRVMLAAAGRQAEDTELIERHLDEAILKELPPLEWGLPLIKLLAAIAPLLGLLGTVVGMILTFETISLYGSSDPKLMAGGISQALVTTVQGLLTAIPLLLLHSLAASTSRRLEQTLDEQAAALVARRMEGQGLD